jgi:HTH-type transcriptional regulator, sugar sensing transcriptional regulator
VNEQFGKQYKKYFSGDHEKDEYIGAHLSPYHLPSDTEEFWRSCSKYLNNRRSLLTMQNIPGTLIASLIDLGLSNYEARTYAALVLFDVTEVKELVDFLGISKPSVYAGLDKLAEMGLAVKRTSKPAMYSPIQPEIAIKILMGRHKTSADIALKELRKLEHEKIYKERSDAVWTVYGDSNINFKIQSMIRNARHSIEGTMAERYLPFLEGVTMKKIALKLVVLSEDHHLINELKQQFPGQNHEITVLSLKNIVAHLPVLFGGVNDPENFIKLENSLQLIVDDRELLSIPPISCTNVTGMNTTNKAMILHTRAMSNALWEKMTQKGNTDIQV